jgi:hypothetical protein
MSWNQLGTNILGNAQNQYLGWSTALNSNGNVLALGTNNNLIQAKLFQYVNSNWIPYGTNNGIITTPNVGTVSSISLNSSGNTVALQVNNTNIYIYRINVSNVWNTIGSIPAPFAAGGADGGVGRVISLSDDGNSIAIGELTWPGRNDASNRRGRASVWTYAGGTNWTQKGGYIEGESNFPINYSERLGSSVSLSGNGNYLVVGSPYYRNETSYPNSPGGCNIYQFNGSNWVKIGDTLYVYNSSSPTSNSLWGAYVSINDATSVNDIVIAMCSQASNYTRVYKYDDLSGSKWTLLGSDIYGGLCMQLDTTGTKIATTYKDGNFPFTWPTKSYQYNGTNWIQYSNTVTIPNQVSMLALSKSSGSMVVGQPWYFESSWSITPSPNPVSYTNYGLIQAYGILNTASISNVPSSQSVPYNQSSYQLVPSSNSPAPFIYSSSNSAIVSVTDTGLVSYNNIGNAIITVSQNATTGYTSASTTMNVTVNRITTNISVVTPINKIYGDSPFNLNATSNSPAIISYSSSNTNIATVNSDGLVTILQATPTPINILIQQSQTEYYTSASTSVTIYIEKQLTIINCQSIISAIYRFGSQVFPFPCSSNNPEPFVYTIIDPNNNVATLDSSNNIVILGVGQASYIITQVANTNYTSGEYNGVIQVTLPITNNNQLVSSLTEQNLKVYLVENNINLDQNQIPLIANIEKTLVVNTFTNITVNNIPG